MQDHFLFEREREAVIDIIHEAGLVKRGDFVLASGAKSNTYIDLREYRSSPKILRALTEIYAKVLRELGAESFIEVPSAMSGVAGTLSLELDVPYVTIRKEKKDHGATKDIMGNLDPSKKFVMIDDVLTSGTNTIPVYKKCLEAGVEPIALVVLVDREAWRDKFKAEGIELPVISGMTLSHIEEYLGAKEKALPL